MKLLIMQCFPASCHFLPLRSKNIKSFHIFTKEKNTSWTMYQHYHKHIMEDYDVIVIIITTV
jgi:hypothetical protein